MNHWLKRIALIAPPVIIAGVYFKVIPVGKDVQKNIDQVIAFTQKKEVSRTPVRIEKVAGEVLLKEKSGLPFSPVKGGEVLLKNASIMTADDSYALLSFSGESSWRIKLGPETQLNIDEFILEEEKIAMNLLKGKLIAEVKVPENKQLMSLRTKTASFNVTGTLFAVMTDGEKKTLLTVKEGEVLTESYKTMNKTYVRDAQTYIENREGEKRLEIDMDSLELYPWNPAEIDARFPSMEDVVALIGDVGPTMDDREKEKRELLKDIDVAIDLFKSQNNDLMRELSILKENAQLSREGLRREIPIVEKDIRCIETSVSECNLMKDRLLLKRGFPRLWGNKRYRHSMVVELQKYLQERDAEVESREEEFRILDKLMKERIRVLNEVEWNRSQNTELEKILPKLQDARLKR